LQYVKVQQDLPRHHKTRKLARLLGTGRAQATGYLVCLWSWALIHAPDGDLSRFDVDDIAEEAGWEWGPLLETAPGDHFVKALVDSGFLDRPESGGDSPPLRIHDWGLHSGAFLAANDGGAAGNHIRWHVNRDRIDPACSLCIPPISPPDRGGMSAGIAEEKRREEKEPSARRRAVRQVDPRFEEFWAAYPLRRDRASAGKAWAKLTPEEATAAIDGAKRYAAWLAAQPDPPRTKYAQGWLTARRWEDELEPPAAGGRRALEQPL